MSQLLRSPLLLMLRSMHAPASYMGDTRQRFAAVAVDNRSDTDTTSPQPLVIDSFKSFRSCFGSLVKGQVQRREESGPEPKGASVSGCSPHTSFRGQC